MLNNIEYVILNLTNEGQCFSKIGMEDHHLHKEIIFADSMEVFAQCLISKM